MLKYTTCIQHVDKVETPLMMWKVKENYKMPVIVYNVQLQISHTINILMLYLNVLQKSIVPFETLYLDSISNQNFKNALYVMTDGKL